MKNLYLISHPGFCNVVFGVSDGHEQLYAAYLNLKTVHKMNRLAVDRSAGAQQAQKVENCTLVKKKLNEPRECLFKGLRSKVLVEKIPVDADRHTHTQIFLFTPKRDARYLFASKYNCWCEA